jgi:CDP-4-dehydro-6-deoxyglucose reductase
MYNYFPCTVVDLIEESDRVRRFFIRFQPEVQFSFRPGQFVMLNLPIASKVTNRAYSIASAPSDDNTFELVISKKHHGLGSSFLFNEVHKGTILQSSMALGKFGLPEIIDADICFVSTGTGIAPIRSMLQHLFAKRIPHKNIYLIFGNRWEKDILYRKEFETMEQKHPEFRFIPVLSRDNPGWSGKKGYVHPVYEELFADRRKAWFYLCGWEAMTKEARLRLEAMGYDRPHVRFEVYD